MIYAYPASCSTYYPVISAKNIANIASRWKSVSRNLVEKMADPGLKKGQYRHPANLVRGPLRHHTEKETQRHTRPQHTATHRHTHKPTDTLTHTDTHAHSHTHTQTHTYTNTNTHNHTLIPTEDLTDTYSTRKLHY